MKTEPTYWLKSNLPAPFDRRFLKTPLFDLATIGTDPAQAADFASRFALVPDPFPLETKNALEDLGPRQLGKGGPTQPSADPAVDGPATITASAVKGLRVVTEEIRERAFKAAGLSDAERAQWDRWRDHKRSMPDKDILVANVKYKARPLDGVWATPPYLHNASVPNLDALLSPVAARPGSFVIGSTEFDTDLVGYRTDGGENDFTIDTSLAGNYNTGHEFRDLTLLELELAINHTSDLAPTKSPAERWAELLGIKLKEYQELTEAERRQAPAGDLREGHEESPRRQGVAVAVLRGHRARARPGRACGDHRVRQVTLNQTETRGPSADVRDASRPPRRKSPAGRGGRYRRYLEGQ